jgi:hypothetical protein
LRQSLRTSDAVPRVSNIATGLPVADLALGGWQVNSILQFHSGFPITAQASDNSGTTSGFPRADCDGPPDETAGKRSTIPGSPGYQWFSGNTVSQPGTGTFGNCQVGSFDVILELPGSTLHGGDTVDVYWQNLLDGTEKPMSGHVPLFVQ